MRHLVALLVGPPQALQEFDICGDDPVERRGDGSWLAITARENAFPPEVERLCHMKPGRARVDRRERSRSRVARGMGRADRDDQGRAVNLIASEPDGGDRRAGLVHNAHRPFGFGPEIATRFFQLLAHEHHGSIAA